MCVIWTEELLAEETMSVSPTLRVGLRSNFNQGRGSWYSSRNIGRGKILRLVRYSAITQQFFAIGGVQVFVGDFSTNEDIKFDPIFRAALWVVSDFEGSRGKRRDSLLYMSLTIKAGS